MTKDRERIQRLVKLLVNSSRILSLSHSQNERIIFSFRLRAASWRRAWYCDYGIDNEINIGRFFSFWVFDIVWLFLTNDNNNVLLLHNWTYLLEILPILTFALKYSGSSSCKLENFASLGLDVTEKTAIYFALPIVTYRITDKLLKLVSWQLIQMKEPLNFV